MDLGKGDKGLGFPSARLHSLQESLQHAKMQRVSTSNIRILKLYLDIQTNKKEIAKYL